LCTPVVRAGGGRMRAVTEMSQLRKDLQRLASPGYGHRCGTSEAGACSPASVVAKALPSSPFAGVHAGRHKQLSWRDGFRWTQANPSPPSWQCGAVPQLHQVVQQRPAAPALGADGRPRCGDYGPRRLTRTVVLLESSFHLPGVGRWLRDGRAASGLVEPSPAPEQDQRSHQHQHDPGGSHELDDQSRPILFAHQ
jgi:hypothetical protein